MEKLDILLSAQRIKILESSREDFARALSPIAHKENKALQNAYSAIETAFVSAIRAEATFLSSATEQTSQQS